MHDVEYPAAPQQAPLEQAREHIFHLQRALESRTDISVAVGILVERNSWSRQQAFDWLVALSQNTNTKIVTLARSVITDTEQPG